MRATFTICNVVTLLTPNLTHPPIPQKVATLQDHHSSHPPSLNKKPIALQQRLMIMLYQLLWMLSYFLCIIMCRNFSHYGIVQQTLQLIFQTPTPRNQYYSLVVMTVSPVCCVLCPDQFACFVHHKLPADAVASSPFVLRNPSHAWSCLVVTTVSPSCCVLRRTDLCTLCAVQIVLHLAESKPHSNSVTMNEQF